MHVLKWPIHQLLQRLFAHINIETPEVAHRICRWIPAQCPFERDIVLWGRTIAHIPPLCKLNPAYEDLMTLRFRALCFLADRCGEDITPYCH